MTLMCGRCGCPFIKHNKSKSTYCKECERQYSREYKRKNPRKQKASTLKYYHNITLEQYDQMWADQDGKCPVCLEDLIEGRGNSNSKGAVVDHDHNCCESTPTCGHCVRGLLCNQCNRALGLFKDDRDMLVRATTYLEGEQG